MAVTYRLAMRCPVYKQRDFHLGFDTELENWIGGGKGKGTSGSPARPKVPIRRSGTDCLVVAWKRRNARGAKGGRQAIRVMIDGSTGNGRNRLVVAEGGSLNGWHEPCDGRLSHTVLRAPRGAIPTGDSAAAGNRCPYRDLGDSAMNDAQASALAPILDSTETG